MKDVQVDWSKVPDDAAGVAMDGDTCWCSYDSLAEVDDSSKEWLQAEEGIARFIGNDKDLNWSNGVPWDQPWTDPASLY